MIRYNLTIIATLFCLTFGVSVRAQHKFVKPAFLVKNRIKAKYLNECNDNLDVYGAWAGQIYISSTWNRRLSPAKSLDAAISSQPNSLEEFKNSTTSDVSSDVPFEEYLYETKDWSFGVRKYTKEFCDENGITNYVFFEAKCDTTYMGLYDLHIAIESNLVKDKTVRKHEFEEWLDDFSGIKFVDPQSLSRHNKVRFAPRYRWLLTNYRRQVYSTYKDMLERDYIRWSFDRVITSYDLEEKYGWDDSCFIEFTKGNLNALAKGLANREFELGRSTVEAFRNSYLNHQYSYAKYDLIKRRLANFQVDADVFLNYLNHIDRHDILDSLKLFYEFENYSLNYLFNVRYSGEMKFLEYPQWNTGFIVDYLVSTLADCGGVKDYKGINYVHIPRDTTHEEFFLLVTSSAEKVRYYVSKSILQEDGSWSHELKDIPLNRKVLHADQVKQIGEHLLLNFPDSVFLCLLNSNPAKIISFASNVNFDEGYWLIAQNTIVGDRSKPRFVYPTENRLTEYVPESEIAELKKANAFDEEQENQSDMKCYSSDLPLLGLNECLPNLDQSKLLYQRKMRVADLNNDGFDELYAYNISNGEIRDVTCYSMVGNDLVEVDDDQARDWLHTEFECHNLLLFSRLILKE